MPAFVVPAGYAAYKLFEYDADGCFCTLRPEQFVGIALVRPGPYPGSPNVQDDRTWAVKIVLKEGFMTVPFDDGEFGERSAKRFCRTLREFIEMDAARNTHNAVLRKGNTHG